jgi:lipopolysaccharide transport system ATP-binding protein
MYVRLAFAVAAHLESEILIVDEVLAVGDAEFQKKCLGKMNDVAKGEGRTVLFVSHNMGSIITLCNKCIFLKNGEIFLETGNVAEGIKEYNAKDIGSFNLCNEFFKIEYIVSMNHLNENESQFTIKDNIYIEIKSQKLINNIENITVLISIQNNKNEIIFSDETQYNNILKYKINSNFLIEGEYNINIIIHERSKTQYFKSESLCKFSVIDIGSNFLIYNHYNYDYGKVFSQGKWIH